MFLHPGNEAEYERRHQPIWAELQEVLRDHGVSNYSIFLHEETLQLFGYAEIEDEAQWASIADTPVCRKWWAHMKDLMATHADDRPVSADLKEVFHME